MAVLGLLIGPQEMIFVALLLLLVFGSSQLPKIAGTIGESLGQLRDIARGLNDGEDGVELDEVLEETESEPAETSPGSQTEPDDE